MKTAFEIVSNVAKWTKHETVSQNEVNIRTHPYLLCALEQFT